MKTVLRAISERLPRATLGLQAATDVTGFGLAGHLLEMAKGSRVSAEIYTEALPFMEQAEELASFGLIPAGTYRNRDHCACRTYVSPQAEELRALLAFDAQTSGGLLLAVPQEREQEACERLRSLGEEAFVVGQVRTLSEKKEQLVIA